MSKIISKILSVFLSFILIFQQSGFAQIAAELNIAGHLTALHNSFIVDKFRPLHLRYLQYLPQDNSFKLYLDKGDQFRGQGIGKKEDGSIFLAPDSGKIEPSPFFSDQTKTLLNYFFIGLTLPNDSFWVNLRPDSSDNIIDDYLAKTDVGKIMLEADLQLKKDTALATSPATPEGREYWNKLYSKAGELFGPENITIPTLTRPWIVPDEIIIRETPNTPSAYIYKATLKVMLEQDYLRGTGYRGQRTATRHPEPRRGEGSNSLDSSPSASPQGQNDYSFKDPRSKALNEYSTQLIRELIIPKLTKDVNSSKRYAPLRQVYYSLILAQWFKARFKQPASLRGREAAEAISSRIDSHNLTNLISNEPWSKTTYFQAYQKSFKDGEYNIQEPVYTPTGQTIRSYFSGGMMLKVNVGNLGAISSGSSPMIAIVAKNPIPSMQNLIEITSASPLEKKTEDILRLSDNPDIKGVWDRIVVEHLQLYKFTRLLRELSGTEGGYVPFYEFPKDKLNYLMSLIDFKSLEPYALKYHLGFITMNGWPYGRNVEDTFLFNFMLLVAIIKCGIPIEKVLISTNKFSLYYMLSNFKQHHRFISDSIDQMTIYSEITSEIKSGGFTLKKEEKSTLIKIIDDLIFNLLPSERISFDEYAEFKYKGGPISAQIKILDEYKSKFDPELFVHPRQYIEGQEIIAQDSQAKSKIFWTNINERLGPTVPLEEIGKIRKIKLADGQEVFAKRINPLRVRTPEEEIEIAERVDKALQNINKHFHAQKFIGIIYDKGVFYLLSLAITYQRSIFKEIYGVDYNKFLLTGGGDQIKEIPVEVTEIQDIVEREGITDIRGWAGLKDILIAGAGDDVDYYVLDFETHPYDTPTAGSPAQDQTASSAVEKKVSTYPRKPLIEPDKKIVGNVVMPNGDKLNLRVGRDDKRGLFSAVFFDADDAQIGFVDVYLNRLLINYAYVQEAFRGKGYATAIIGAVLKGLKDGQLVGKSWTSFSMYLRNPLLAKTITDFGFAPNLNYAPELITKASLSKAKNTNNKFPLYVEDAAKRKNIENYINDEPYWQENFEVVLEPPPDSEDVLIFTTYYQVNPGKVDEKLAADKIKVSFESPLVSSPLGGIDFRSLPIVTQAMSNLRNNLGDTFQQVVNARRKVSPTAGVDSRLRGNDTERLDKELQEIEKLIEAGITPSAERIKEYLASSCLKEEKSDSHKERDSHFSSDMQKVVSCIAGILRLEEDRCYPTEPTLKDLLVVLEAGMPNQELRAIFSGVY